MPPARARTQTARSEVQRAHAFTLRKTKHSHLHQFFHRTSLYTTLLPPQCKTEPAIKKESTELLLSFNHKTSKQIIVLGNAGWANALFAARKILLHLVEISQSEKARCQLNQLAVNINTKEIDSLYIFVRLFVVVFNIFSQSQLIDFTFNYPPRSRHFRLMSRNAG